MVIHLKTRLYPISPIHIGCDDVYEPTSFVINDNKRLLIEFDGIHFVKTLSKQEKDEFLQICSQGNIASILKIYQFIYNRRSSIIGKEVNISEALIKHYKTVLSISTTDENEIKKDLNKFTINKTAYNPLNNISYIPGSSIKGAIRTAYLSILAEEKKIENWRGMHKELEKKLLNGEFLTDPFRMLKISDFLPKGEAKTKIVYAVNKKKKLSKFSARGPYQILETITTGVAYEGFIDIETPQQGANIREPIQLEKLMTSSNKFYKKIFDDEDKAIKEIGAKSIRDKIEKIESRLNKNMFLIRVGRHSGAEAITIEGKREIKIMQRRGSKPKIFDHSTTLWLASEENNPSKNDSLLPFGWAVVEILNN